MILVASLVAKSSPLFNSNTVMIVFKISCQLTLTISSRNHSPWFIYLLVCYQISALLLQLQY